MLPRLTLAALCYGSLANAQIAAQGEAPASAADTDLESAESAAVPQAEPTPEAALNTSSAPLDPDHLIKGRGYLALEAQLFSVTTAELELSNSLVAGTLEQRTTVLGLGSPSWGVTLGYGGTESVIVGTRLLYQSLDQDLGEVNQKVTGFGFLPYLRVSPKRRGPLRPYSALTVGYQKGTTEVDGVDFGGVDGLSYGGGAGLYAFVGRALSIEPAINVLWNTVKVTDGAGGAVTGTNMSIAVTVAFGVWFGDSSARWSAPPPQVSTEEAAEEEATHGLLSVDVEEGKQRLQLQVDPDQTSPQFTATFSVPERVAEDPEGAALPRPQLPQACTEVVWASADAYGKTKALATRIKRNGVSSVQLLALVPYRALKRGIGEHEARISLCGRDWELNTQSRVKVLRYLKAFRSRARRAGTFESARAIAVAGRSAEAAAAPVAPLSPQATTTPTDPKAPVKPPPPTSSFPIEQPAPATTPVP